ncbi:MAG: hypothetical protein AAF704_10555 [Cyanobacteria bacterium P01_D01_bin.123]
MSPEVDFHQSTHAQPLDAVYFSSVGRRVFSGLTLHDASDLIVAAFGYQLK